MFKMATPTVTWMPSLDSWRRKRQRSGQVYCIVLSRRLTTVPRLVEFAQLLCKQRYEPVARAGDRRHDRAIKDASFK